jgi:hypothetical protein
VLLLPARRALAAAAGAAAADANTVQAGNVTHGSASLIKSNGMGRTARMYSLAY